MRKATLMLPVYYDEDKTDGDSIAFAFDTLLETIMSTPGILDDYGKVDVGEFSLEDAPAIIFSCDDVDTELTQILGRDSTEEELSAACYWINKDFDCSSVFERIRDILRWRRDEIIKEGRTRAQDQEEAS